MAPYLFSPTHWYIPESVCCTLWMVSSPFNISTPLCKKEGNIKGHRSKLFHVNIQSWYSRVRWYLRCQGQTITKPAIGGPGPPRGLALPPELLSTIHLSIINHSDPLREGWKIEKKCFRMSNIVYPGKGYWKAHAWFQAWLKPVKYKNRCVHKYGVRKSFHACADVQSKPFLCSFHICWEFFLKESTAHSRFQGI